ncbi:unnamed protein product [Hydatigera taeniaeformis]|uniref:DUF2157 domain-containing protein n=1 Tax=Hydatigena taeniaeformis TaxID=6205 RepID=A0A0R3X7T9_HYDTA|nr:unnamed protein product [Hydatigera taeniaeformis]
MDRRIGYIIIALVAALLFFVAIGYHGWACGDSILSSNCLRFKINEVTGALLLTAGLLILVAGIFLIVLVLTETSWSEIAAAVIAIVAAILAIAGVFYYLDHMGMWSPFIATIAMSLSIALAAILLFDLITGEIGYIIIALVAALLFFVAIGYHGWACGDSILSSNCLKVKINEVTGALLLTASLLILVAGILLIVLLVTETSWGEIAAAVIATVAAILAIAAAILFFVAIGYNDWECGGSILGPKCRQNKVNKVTGALLLVAGLLILIAGVFLILLLFKGNSWGEIASAVITTVAAIFALIGVFFYLDQRRLWSPFIATIAMSLSVALAGILLFELIVHEV